MKALFKKELIGYFSSYVALSSAFFYVIICGLFLFVFSGEFNLFERGYADLSYYFELSPWLLALIVPAISMRSFSEEKKTGTFDLLLNYPLSSWQVIISKYLSSLLILLIVVFPTLLYTFSIYYLSYPVGEVDFSVIFSGYLGIFFLLCLYNSIGIFCSCFSSSPVVVFLISSASCFLLYYGFEGIGFFNLKNIGIYEHYKNIGYGVLTFSNIVYFIGVSFIFLIIAQYVISVWKPKIVKLYFKIIFSLGILFLSHAVVWQIDFTSDKKYTLSDYTYKILNQINKPLVVDLYLSDTDLPVEFERLKEEVGNFLERCKLYTLDPNNIMVREIALNKMSSDKQFQIINRLSEIGVVPFSVTTNKNGKIITQQIYPWAIVTSGNRTIKIPLVKNSVGKDLKSLVLEAIQRLEHDFIKAFTSVLNSKKEQAISILKGNGQLQDLQIADLLKSLTPYYRLYPFSLDSIQENPSKSLSKLLESELLISAKPSEKFSDKEKHFLDQYLMNGGKMIWLIDAVSADIDSIYNAKNNKIVIYPYDLNLTDYFFSYGVRFNYNLVADLQAAPILVASGQGSNTYYNKIPWIHTPMVSSEVDHLITKSIKPVRLNFAGVIDTTIKTKSLKRTVLLNTSSQTTISPGIHYLSIEDIGRGYDPKLFNKGKQAVAVLLEGKFKSMYAGRVKPLENINSIDSIENTQMLVISDGELIKNQVFKGQPLELGYDKWTHSYYGNKDFIINGIDYLMGKQSLLKLKSKEFKIPQLNSIKTSEESLKWQFFNILLPLICYLLFMIAFVFDRKKQFLK